LWLTVLGGPGSAALAALQHQTSGIKTAAPIITSALVTLLAVTALRGERDFRAFRRAVELAVILVTALSLWGWALGTHFFPVDADRLILDTTRLEGFSTLDSNGLGRLLLFPVLLFVSAALAAPRILGKRGWAALAMALTCILLTQSRTTYVSFTVGLIVLTFFNLSKIRTWWFIAAAVSWIGAIVAWTNLGKSFERGSERLTWTSLELRAELWRGVLRIIKDHPWFGAHPSGYLDQMQKLGLLTEQVNSAHSLYLAVGVEWGVPMVVLVVVVMVTSFRYGCRVVSLVRRDPLFTETRTLGASITAASLAYAVHGISEIVSPLTLFLLFGCAVATRRFTQADQAKLRRTPAPLKSSRRQVMAA
jgi:O-antigen ligase